MCYLMPKPSLQKNSSGTIELITGEHKGIYNFPKSINPKVNVIVQLEVDLTMMSLSSKLTTVP